MSTKKGIGKAFRERLDEVNDTPDDFVWTNIESELKRLRRNKVLTIITTVLLLLFFIFYFSITTKYNSKTKNSDNSLLLITNKDSAFENKTNTTNIKVKNNIIKSNIENLTLDNLKTQKSNTKLKHRISSSNPILGSSSEGLSKNNIKNQKTDLKQKLKSKNRILTSNSDLSSSPESLSKNNSKTKKVNLNQNTKSKNNIVTSKNISNYNPKDISALNIKKEIYIPITNKIKNHNLTFDIKPLSLNIKPQKTFTKINKWSATAVSGFNYYSSLTKGNPFDTNLSSNNVDNRISLFYGVYFNYHINKKTIIRFGIHKTKINNRTLDIGLANTILNINFIDLNNTISNALMQDETMANLTQEISYLEFPLELRNNLINKKHNLDIVWGFSFLELKENNVYVDAENISKTLVGSTYNISPYNFSINIGVASQIKLFKNTSLNIELNYKQHLLLYLKNTTNLTPFTIGLQSGIRYQF